VLLILLLGSPSIYSQKFENPALTPPMGWNGWNEFGCSVKVNF